MKKIGLLFLLLNIVLLSNCIAKTIAFKPRWVKQRPVNTMYYNGIGIATKKGNKNQYQQQAKKEAMADLISEIGVQVKSQSILQQFQNNTNFSQQFESEIKLDAINNLSNFEVVDTWENKDFFWIYIRINKTLYHAERNKKINEIRAQAFWLFDNCKSQAKHGEHPQAIKSGLMALAKLQNFLFEDIEESAFGIPLQLEILDFIQQQLNAMELSCNLSDLKVKAGQNQNTAIIYTLNSKNDTGLFPVKSMPIMISLISNQIKTTETQITSRNGKVNYTLPLLSKHAVSNRIIAKVTLSQFISDTLNVGLNHLINQLSTPENTLKIIPEATTIFLVCDEKNLDTILTTQPMGLLTKQKLMEQGCRFVLEPENADYLLCIESATKAQGFIWGKMQMSILNATVTLTENKSKHQVYSYKLGEIKGYQTTAENAGINAYKNAESHLTSLIIPELIEEIFKLK